VAARREARRAAVDIVYQADITGAALPRVLDGWRGAGRSIDPFTVALVEGVGAHRPEIDLLLETHSQGWTVARMSALDRSILRVAVEELRWHDDVPDAVAISEAVEAADELSSEDAKRFVNGVLGSIAREGAAGG
jgi:N utilization substance protein B